MVAPWGSDRAPPRARFFWSHCPEEPLAQVTARQPSTHSGQRRPLCGQVRGGGVGSLTQPVTGIPPTCQGLAACWDTYTDRELTPCVVLRGGMPPPGPPPTPQTRFQLPWEDTDQESLCLSCPPSRRPEFWAPSLPTQLPCPSTPPNQSSGHTGSATWMPFAIGTGLAQALGLSRGAPGFSVTLRATVLDHPRRVRGLAQGHTARAGGPGLVPEPAQERHPESPTLDFTFAATVLKFLIL